MSEKSTIHMVPFEEIHGTQFFLAPGERISAEYARILKDQGVAVSFFEEDELVACVGVYVKSQPGTVWVLNLPIDHTALLAEAIRIFLAVTAESNPQLERLKTFVRKSNPGFRTFVEECGFQFDKDLPGPYSEGEELVQLVGYQNKKVR